MNRLVFIVIFVFLILRLDDVGLAQTNNTYTSNDSIVAELPNLALDFYNSMDIVNMNYEYELVKRKRKLEMWASEVNVLGYIGLIGVIAANGVLVYDYNWNLWVDIPCATLVGMSIMIPCILWRNHIMQKANAIEIAPIIGLNADNTVYGVCLKTSF
ncbi:MAG: hypothetical protein J5708_01155 [Bacteroidales bacterium]|nr:hypothetical protein [Bacteroidales bacterium]